MIVAISGTREFERENDIRVQFAALKLGPGDVVVHGKCHLGGVDIAAGRVAKERGCEVREFPVDHAIDGPWPGAGPKRNDRMLRAETYDVLLAFPSKRSRGTRNAISIARRLKIPTHVVEMEDE